MHVHGIYYSHILRVAVHRPLNVLAGSASSLQGFNGYSSIQAGASVERRNLTLKTGAADGSLYNGFGPEAGFGSVSAVRFRHLSCQTMLLP